VLEELIESRKSALKVEEVAQILNVSQRLIYQLVAVGEIPHFKVGSAVRSSRKHSPNGCTKSWRLAARNARITIA
jgi:excisionase family DNA binding protein